MTTFSINANYNKNEHSSELRPTITNSVTINNSDSGFQLPTREELMAKKRSFTKEPKAETNVESVGEPPAANEIRAQNLPSLIVDDSLNAFERRLLGITIAVLSSNDLTLVKNIIDRSGDIILCESDLKDLIGILTGSSNIIVLSQPMTFTCGCLKGKETKMMKEIVKILVDGTDLEITNNYVFNLLGQYKISLDKVVY